MLMWLICLNVGLSSSLACLILEELVGIAFFFSIMYFSISMDSSAWAHLLESCLNCSCNEESLCKNRFMSASYFSLISWLWLSIFDSMITCWLSILLSKILCQALNCSNSTWRLAQWRQSSLLTISVEDCWAWKKWMNRGTGLRHCTWRHKRELLLEGRITKKGVPEVPKIGERFEWKETGAIDNPRMRKWTWDTKR